MDAVQSTLGLAVIDAVYLEEISKGRVVSIGNTISTLLEDVANVVTVGRCITLLSCGDPPRTDLPEQIALSSDALMNRASSFYILLQV
ncbi:hypothetical protein ACG1VR_18520 [Cedecea davisae]|uniref:hypothetical protein n=1 Tax=Cedecea davisae TaxID=158484 RepID=UPI00376EC10A